VPIQTYTTATTEDWSGQDILVDESHWDQFVQSQDHDLAEQLRVYQQGIDQGWITVINQG
jgi:hypothetical protein